MTWLKQKMRGQIALTLPVIISLGSILVGSVLWISNIDKDNSEVHASLRTDIAIDQTNIKNLNEITSDKYCVDCKTILLVEGNSLYLVTLGFKYNNKLYGGSIIPLKKTLT